MKKIMSIFLMLAMLATLSFNVMAETSDAISTKDLKQSDKLVNQFLVAMRDLDFNSYINVFIDEDYNDRNEMYNAHKAAFNSLKNTEQKIDAFEIIDKTIIDKTNVKYIVKLYEKSGVVWQGARYTKKINDKWYVYQYSDLEKHRFDVIQVPEYDRERFEKLKRAEADEQSVSPNVVVTPAFSQTMIASWNLGNWNGGNAVVATGINYTGSPSALIINMQQGNSGGYTVGFNYTVETPLGLVNAYKMIRASSANVAMNVYVSSFTNAKLRVTYYDLPPSATYWTLGELYSVWY